MQENTTTQRALAATPKTKVVEITAGKHLPPARGQFVPRYQREAMADAWRGGRATLTQLQRRNPGMGLRDVELAILDELDARERRREALAANAAYLLRRAA